MTRELVIIGGSYAACEIAGAARQQGYDGKIRILSDEDQFPYHRPPLSKAFLLGTADESGLPLKGEKYYQDNEIDISFNARATAIDTVSREVTIADGHAIKFDRLALSVGARPRTLSLPGSDYKNVLYLRSIADARALKHAAETANNVAVIGGGFIGLEVASALAQRGRNVKVIEAQDHVLNRVVAPAISSFFTAAHRGHGVEILTKAKIVEIKGDANGACAIILEDNSILPADLVLVGIGSVPNVELAAAIGIACNNGIVVDLHGRTSHPDIFAAGDCTFCAGPYAKNGMRLESVQNAIDQARCAGANIAGVEKTYDSVPWFWSDQFNFKLQIAGISSGFDSFVQRSKSSDTQSVFYFKDDRWTALDTINQPRDHMLARRLLSRPAISRQMLAEVDYDLAALAPGERTRHR